MAKAKVLADTISITSEVLTDENIRKVKALSPATLKIVDENEGELYSVISTDYNSNVNAYGAAFKNGEAVGRVPNFNDIEDDKKEEYITNYLLPILVRINAIESAVEEFLNDNEFDDIAEDIEFM
jgi:hypothetical protein